MSQLTIIIITFGRQELTRKTLQSLFDCGIDNETTIIVVDNGSQPDLVQMLVGFKDQLDCLILLNRNYGKPYALNLAIKTALESCTVTNKSIPEYFLLCDNDLEFLPNWKTRLIETYTEHKDLPLCCLSACRWSSHPLDITKGKITEINKLRFCAGCCMLISRQALRANGLFDTRRMIGTVDTSYMRAAIGRGYVNAAVHPETLIRHTGIAFRCWDLNTRQPKLLP